MVAWECPTNPREASGLDPEAVHLLGPNGNATEYPTNLSVGESGTVIAGVTNNEYEDEVYTLALRLEDEPIAARTISVPDGATREESFEIPPESPGRQRLQVRLFLGESAGDWDDPYRRARLWITVSE